MIDTITWINYLFFLRNFEFETLVRTVFVFLFLFKLKGTNKIDFFQDEMKERSNEEEEEEEEKEEEENSEEKDDEEDVEKNRIVIEKT